MKTRFLLADDDADDGNLFCEAVMKIGTQMDCRTVQNGRKLLELLASGEYQPEVIFLDINMPIMNGWECLTSLKKDSRFRDIPVIIYSTSSLPKDVERAYGLGAHLFLAKPENFGELCQILKLVASKSSQTLLASLSEFSSVKRQ